MKNNITKIVEEFDFDKVKVNSFTVDDVFRTLVENVHKRLMTEDCPVLTYTEYQTWELNLKSENPILYKIKDNDEMELIVNEMYSNITYEKGRKRYYMPLNFNWLDTSNVTNFDMMFCDLDDNFSKRDGHLEKPRYLEISKLNTRNVRSMRLLFNSCQLCDKTDISDWDVSNCMNFSDLISYSNFSSENIKKIKSKWNINPNADITDMFNRKDNCVRSDD